MFKNYFTLLWMFFVPLIGGWAQGLSYDTLSLEACIEYGLNNGYSVQKALLDERKAKYNVREITASGLPQINAYGNLDYYAKIPVQVIPGEVFGMEEDLAVQFGKKHNATGGVQLSQLIFNQSYLIGLRAARTSEEFYRLLSEQSEEDIIYDISLNYYATLESELQMKNLESNYQRLLKLQDILKAQYENDLVRKVEYNRVKVSTVTLQNQMSQLETGIEQRKNYLKLLMGMPISTPLNLDQQAFMDAGDIVLNNADTANINTRIDIQQLNKQAELYELDILNKKAGYYPSLSAIADYSYNAMRDEFNYFDGDKEWYQTFIIGLRLKIPIFDGLQKKNSIAQSRVDVLKLEQDRTMAEQNAIMEIRNAIEQLENSLGMLEAQKENLELAEDVYDETDMLYRQDLVNLTDLLEAETSLREARSAYYTQILQAKTAYIDLLKAQGEIKNIKG